MDDIKKDPFEEYIRQSEPSKRELGYAWYTAMGLQAVDGLETSDYLRNTARKNIEGEISITEAGKLIENYYEESKERDTDRTKEADIVSARIANILSEKAFTFSVPQYIGIHRRLFEGIFSHAGKVRDYNISKKEWVLDGESVHYGNALELKEMLEYDIRTEKEYEYPLNSISSIIPHLAKFVSSLWQIHAFGEGNTRTTAVFFIKYLRSMGFDVTNDIFAENAWFFRNSLVRANYTDLSKGIRETTEYLELFLRNLLLGESNELKNRYMHVRWENQKQDIQEQKQDIQNKKQDIETEKEYIEIPDNISNKTKQHIQELFKEYGYDRFFGRTEVMRILSITASPASALIKRMLEAGLIYSMKGKGKGKYLFGRNDNMVKTVEIVSLSSGIIGEPFVAHELRIGEERLKSMGLKVKYSSHTLKGIDYIKEHPEDRASDLIEAFADPEVDIILCAIGGDDTYRLLPFLFQDDRLKKVICEKIFLGFSDTTMNHFMLHKLGLKTFYGQSFLADLCELDNDMLPYSKKYFEELIRTGTIREICPSNVWYEERTSFDESQIGVPRISHKNNGYKLLQGPSAFSGKILGGCIDSIYDIFNNDRYEDSISLCEKYGLFPSLDDWKGRILLLETSEEKPTPEMYEKMLHALKEYGLFDVISGVLVGKPIDETYSTEYCDLLVKVIDKPELPILYNINIGHATPRCIIPFGVNAHVDAEQQVISFE